MVPLIFEPFGLNWPPGMESVLSMTVLYKEGVARCSNCGSKNLESIDQNRSRCIECGTTLKDRLTSSDIPKLFEMMKGGSKDEKIMASHMLNNPKYTDLKTITPHADKIFETYDSNLPIVRSNMAGVTARIAEDRPGKVKEAVPKLIDLLDDELDVRKNAAVALAYISQGYPKEVLPALEKVIELMKREPLSNYMAVVASLAETYPDEVLPYLELIVNYIEDGEMVNNSLYALTHLADPHPDEVRKYKKVIKSLLDHEDPIKQAASSILEDMGS
ncbi:MAG: hypothetical protein ACOCT7_02230 [Candidatus Saliniplasma sp.]